MSNASIYMVSAEDMTSRVEVLVSSERAAKGLVRKLRPRYGEDACYEAVPLYRTSKAAFESVWWPVNRHEEPSSWPGSDTEPSDPWQTSGPGSM